MVPLVPSFHDSLQNRMAGISLTEQKKVGGKRTPVPVMIWMTVTVCSQRIVHNYSDETQQLANGHHKTPLCNLLQKNGYMKSLFF